MEETEIIREKKSPRERIERAYREVEEDNRLRNQMLADPATRQIRQEIREGFKDIRREFSGENEKEQERND